MPRSQVSPGPHGLSRGRGSKSVGAALRRQRLGRQLRLLREARSLRLQDVAEHLGLVPSTLSRIESGQSPTRTSYLALMLDLYGIDDPGQRASLTELAREGQRKGWWSDYADLLSAGECNYLGLETAASQVRSFSLQTVPALLQTRRYAMAACRAERPDLGPAQVDRLVAVILRRQQALLGEQQSAHLIIDESALLRVIGPGDLMASQMRHLLEMADLLPVRIEVLALAAPRIVLSPPFTLLSFDDPADTDVAFGQSAVGKAYVTRRVTEVAALHATFTALARTAMSPASSVKLIRQLVGRSG